MTICKMPQLLSETMSWNEIVEHTTNQLARLHPKIPRQNFIKWFSTKEYVGRPFDPNLVFQCYDAHCRALKDYDNFWAICGNEGSGKSLLARNIAYMIDPNFSIDKIVFTLEEYMNLLEQMLKKGERGGCIVIDEGGQLMFSRDAMSSTNKILVKTAMMQRKLNLTVLICIPNFFLLDSYPRQSRVSLLIQIKDRGKYKGIMKKGINKVSVEGIKYKNVLGLKLPLTMFWEGESNMITPKGFSVEDYEDKKDHYMLMYFQDARKSKVGEGYAIKMIDAAREIGMKDSQLRDWCKLGKVKAFKIGFNWFLQRKDYEELRNSLKPKEID